MFSLPLQYLNVKLNDISVPDPDKYPHMVCTHIAECISIYTSPATQINMSDVETFCLAAAVCQKLFHSWLSGEVCSAAC